MLRHARSLAALAGEQCQQSYHYSSLLPFVSLRARYGRAAPLDQTSTPAESGSKTHEQDQIAFMKAPLCPEPR